jgi:hypothetical protein
MLATGLIAGRGLECCHVTIAGMRIGVSGGNVSPDDAENPPREIPIRQDLNPEVR